MRDPRDGELRDRELRLFAPAGRGVIVEIDEPADAAAAAARRGRAADRAGPPPRLRAPGRAGQGARARAPRPRRAASRAASSSSTTSTPTAHLVPVDRSPAMNEAGIVVGVTRSFTDRHPEGMQRVVLLGDPTKSLGSRRRAGVPADHRRARPGRGARRAGRVVRAVLRRADLDGLRHREHGLGRRGAAPDHRVHAGTAARSTSSSPASTSARSRTGTPRRRCSCTRAASW